MTISEKKIELEQGLLLLQDKATLFEIEKLISASFGNKKKGDANSSILEEKHLVTFEAWTSQFEALEQLDVEDEFTSSPMELRQRIWAAEQSGDLSLEAFFQRVAQN